MHKIILKTDIYGTIYSSSYDRGGIIVIMISMTTTFTLIYIYICKRKRVHSIYI